MYYIWSLFISIVLLVIIVYIEKQKNDNKNIKYDIFSLSNLLIFGIIYLISTILCYFVISDDNLLINIENEKVIIDNKYEKIDTKKNIDPLILKRISDNFDTGFEPYDNEL